MLPLRLELRNFMAWRELDALRLEGLQLACLSGPNGAGKSALLDAISWALWGRARGRRNDELVREGSREMRVQLDFEQDGVVYRVLRQRRRGQRGEGTLALFVRAAEGDFTLISEAGLRATQRRITQLLRLDFDTFVHSAWLQQGRADAFTTRPPAERKQLLADILDLSRWQHYEETARERLSALETQLTLLQTRGAELEADLAREDALQAALDTARAAHETALRNQKAAEADARAGEHLPHDLRHARERLVETRAALHQAHADAGDIAAECERQRQRIADFEAVSARQAEIEAGWDALQDARQESRQLAESLHRLGDFRAREQTLQHRLRDAREELAGQAGALQARIAELQREVDAAPGEALAQTRERIAALRALERERAQAQTDANRDRAAYARLQGENRGLRGTMEGLRARIDSLKRAGGGTCPLCGQPLDEDGRAALIEQLQQEGAAQGDRWRANEGRMRELAAAGEPRRARITALDEELRQLQPALARVGQLQARAEAAVQAGERLHAENVALDALQARLDAEDYAPELRAQLAALERSRREVGYDSAQHDATRQQLEHFEAFEQRQTALQVALQGLPEAREALAAAEERRARNQAAQQSAAQQIDRLERDIERLEEGLGAQRERQAEVARTQAEARQTGQALVSAQQELAALESMRARREQLQLRADVVHHEAGLYRELRRAFSRDGVPAMLIDSAIPELEANANALLLRMTDGRLSVHLSTTRERLRGGEIDTLDIRVADELGLRDYELFSGGEAFRINFALRIALSRMLARRAGARLRTLFIDEGFGTQDAAGRERLVEAIAAIQPDFDLILVITHIEELRERFPRHILVEKHAEGSRLRLQ